MHAPMSPVDIAQMNLRAAVVVLLHELSYDSMGQKFGLSLSAEQGPDGQIEGDYTLNNRVTGELVGGSL